MKRIDVVSRIGLATAVVLALAAGAAEGAWLVTTDGTKIETRGPWQARDGLVVFTNVDGVLVSMRLSKCDLEASRAATEAAARAATERAAPAPAPPPRRPVFVLTDADVEHVRKEPVVEDEQDEEDDSEPEERASGAGIVVNHWQPKDEEDGISLTGMVRNDSPNVAGNVKMVAVFRDAYGDPIESRPATLSTRTLAPGQRAQFSVPPFGLFGYSSVDFEVVHFEILSGRDDGEPATDGSEPASDVGE